MLQEVGPGIISINTLYSPQALKAKLESVLGTPLFVVPKKAGGKFLFYSQSDVVAGTNNFLMVVTSSPQELADQMNATIGVGGSVDFIIEHGMKTILIINAP